MPRGGGFRGAYLALGLACTGIGFVNFFIPGLPSTVFFIVALWAFQRSSPRLEGWLLSNRLVGSTLQNWLEHRSISRRTKIVAIATIWVFVLVSCLLVKQLWAYLTLGAVAIALTWFLASRKSS